MIYLFFQKVSHSTMHEHHVAILACVLPSSKAKQDIPQTLKPIPSLFFIWCVWIKISWDTKANNPILELTFGMKKLQYEILKLEELQRRKNKTKTKEQEFKIQTLFEIPYVPKDYNLLTMLFSKNLPLFLNAWT